MTSKKIICIIIVCLSSVFSFSFCEAQSTGEIRILRTIADTTEKKPDYKFARNNTNELQMLLAGLFLFYKSFISSQDGISCGFTPSCSEYGMEAVKKQGVVVGIMNTADRLLRCNGLSPEKYTIDEKSHLLRDPVE